ncbi:CDP-glycerol glycerophosphotransferase family protein [Mesoflavibacter zeaxanthinifaciens]|uniref:CDP-glycerol glycerophosphotransferase family protein n=1 Tax=Mesoflavibacter zeaxanthinifaciens TaxID=393060 RepID=UPI0026EFC579|nr:CDP-glycerol glycerophosphotransferase family protein [Mesoflavibacter zeaxanthinifaciens]
MNYKFLIYISYSYAVPIGNPLEKEIKKQGYTIKWFSDLDDGKNALSDKNDVIKHIKDVINYQPDIVLTATDNVPDFISGLKVQVFHGFLTYKRPEKSNIEAHFRIRGFFDLYCTQGPSSTQGFLKQQKRHPHFEVLETGWSKVDPLFPLQDIRKTEKKPIILIASTFTERLSLAYRDDVFDKIKELSLGNNFIFKMVLHPKIPKEIKEKWNRLDNDNFKFYDTTNLIPLFKESDILFADTTSAIQEYLLQLKPVVTFNHTFNHDYLINTTNVDKIEEAFFKALKYPNELTENIIKFVNTLHPYFDGKSSERIINASIFQLTRDKSYLKNKPLNLIRKLKMRKRLGYFTLKSYNKPYTK